MKKYWLMAAAYFGLYGFLLTVMPIIALQHGRTSVEASVLVASLAVVGFVGDLTVSALSARAGKSVAILAGALLIAGGMTLALTFGGFISLLGATGVIGLGLAYIVTPVLGGLSTRAGRNQVRAQAINAVVQRAGALGLGLFLGLAVTEVSAIIAIVAAALVTLILGAALVYREDAKRDVVATNHPAPAVPAWAPVLRSSDVRRALVVNAATPIWIIAGSSLFPLVLLALGRAELLVPAIIAREVVAMITALSVARTRSRKVLFIAWTASMVVGAAGFLLATAASSDVLIVALFALHGACIALGIVFANVLFYDGTTDGSRLIAFSFGSMSSRTAALLFPLAFGVALIISPQSAAVATAAIIVLLSLAVVVMQMRRASAQTAPHSETSFQRNEV